MGLGKRTKHRVTASKFSWERESESQESPAGNLGKTTAVSLSNPSHCTKYVNGEKRFLILALSKRKNSIEKHRAVLTSRSFIKQRESTVSRKVESVLSGKHKEPHSGVGLGVSCVI